MTQPRQFRTGLNAHYNFQRLRLRPDAAIQRLLAERGFVGATLRMFLRGGGGLIHFANGLVIGGHGGGGGSLQTTEQQTLAVGGGHGALDVGLQLRPGPHLRIYPLFSFSFTLWGGVVGDRDDTGPSQLTPDKTRQQPFVRPSLSLHGSVIVLLRWGKTPGAECGIHAGYSLPLLGKGQARGFFVRGLIGGSLERR